MADQSLFGNEHNSPVTPASGAAASPQSQNDNPLATLLAGIKNESGVQKYNSVEDALKGAAHAQEYIATLKREKEEAERRLQEATRTASEVQSKLSEQEELKRTVQELTQKFSQNQSTSDKAISPEAIAELVNSQLTQREQQLLAKSNQTAVVNALKAKFGEKAEEQYNQAAAELGLSVAEMNALAGKSPKAVLKALGIAEQQAQSKSFVPGQSVVNTASFQPNQNSHIGRNNTVLEIGATTQQLNEEATRARAMVNELHEQGLSIDDLTIPKNYFKLFK